MDPYAYISRHKDWYGLERGFERSIFNETEFAHIQRACNIMREFAKRLKSEEEIMFDQPFPKYPKQKVYPIQFLFDGRWWSVDTYVRLFKNPRDGDNIWKEIIINLPNDGFIYTPQNYGEQYHELKSSAINLLVESAKNNFPQLTQGKSMCYHYYAVGHDRINLVLNDQEKKEQLIIKFEYYPPVGNQ